MITPLPTPPSRATPSDFSTKADAFIAALPVFVTEANAQAAALDLNDTTDASTTSNAIGTGAKTFTVTAGKSFQPGMYLMIADTAAPSTNWMCGQVTSYSATTLVMNIVLTGGSGTKTAWTISFSAPTQPFASTAEIVTGTEAAKAIAPDQMNLAGIVPAHIYNLKLVVNGSVNKLDILTRTGGAVPDATHVIRVDIPDGNGNVTRSRAAVYKSGTSQFIMADAANYWSKGSLDAEIKNAYVYAIWDATGGIVWALGGYSGFTRVPATATATDDDFFLLEASSTYTKVITDYCVCVGKIRYQYDTADTPDHTIQATVLDAPQVIWNPRSDYGYQKNLATTVTAGGDINNDLSLVVKQSGKYLIETQALGLVDGGTTTFVTLDLLTGSATLGSAVRKSRGHHFSSQVTNRESVSCSAIVYLNAGDTIHSQGQVLGNGGNRNLYGDSSGATDIGSSHINFKRVD